jgi:hypothetical protein
MGLGGKGEKLTQNSKIKSQKYKVKIKDRGKRPVSLRYYLFLAMTGKKLLLSLDKKVAEMLN